MSNSPDEKFIEPTFPANSQPEELTEDELDLVSGGSPNSGKTKKPKNPKQEDFLVVTMKEVLISG